VGWLLSSVRELPVNLALLYGLRDNGYGGQVAVTAHTSGDARQLKDAGANHVLRPYADAAAEAVDSLFGQDKQTASGSITAVKPEG